MAVQVPMYFEPRPYQKEAWARRLSGQCQFHFEIWHRQAGKDSSDIQYSLFGGYTNPGTQTAYVGLDNKWIRRNIWDKYIEGRRYFDSYPEDILEIRETAQQVKFLNNGDLAPALIQYIGFKESESLIGSSYERFFVSELSLYKRGAFDFIMPIWDMKIAENAPFLANFNFTPRGLNNLAADMLKAYTGEEDPALWPGWHGSTYVDLRPANQTFRTDGTRVLSDEMLEKIRDRYIRAMGNDNLFRQEYMCEFLAVNAGLVYPAIEVIRKEGRYCPANPVPGRPVYMAWDISSKDKQSDWTSGIAFQYIDGRIIIIDWYEDNRKAVVECVQECQVRPWWHMVQAIALPWDSDRSGSSSSPLEECRRAFPGLTVFKLERSYVQDGINRVRRLLPNMVINSAKCEWLMECFENYEYRELSSSDDWSATPKHDRYSHLMDAMRYCADFIEMFPRIRVGSSVGVTNMPSHYGEWGLDNEEETAWADLPPGMRPSVFSSNRKKNPTDLYRTEGGLWIPR